MPAVGKPYPAMGPANAGSDLMGAWKSPAATKEEQREAKRRMLLKVAGRIFNEKGFHNTSPEEIAQDLYRFVHQGAVVR
jgi:hypothetical protein